MGLRYFRCPRARVGDGLPTGQRGLIDKPILNSPFTAPTRHFAIDEHGVPTGVTVDGRHPSAYVVPVAAPRRGRQAELQLDERGGTVTPNDFINELVPSGLS